jgi:hypothetical protein
VTSRENQQLSGLENKITLAAKNGCQNEIINEIKLFMSTNYNKKRYFQLLDQRSIGDNSNDDELSRYACMLTNQLD